MATILDGKKLSEKILAGIKAEIQQSGKQLSFAVIVVGDDPVVAKFISQKERIARDLNVSFQRYEYEKTISTNELRKRIGVIVHEADPTGIIVQLPLPSSINVQSILNSVPSEKDVDVLSARSLGNFFVGKSVVVPPVVGAIQLLLKEYGIEYQSKRIAVIGAGMLVGKPVAAWLLNEKISFSVVDIHSPDISAFTKEADVIISGVGKPGLITGDMVGEGVIIVDAGTSEVGGKLSGDVDFDSVSKKASFITPVPGGVGPLTVAMIFKNLFALAREKS
jgi:methylenetetrahydrofolate dehydrogenase (NADP+)/methenyltetrahydrofolate cyclohydrolase